MKIKHLKHSQIDFRKWDNCISKSTNCLIYAYSWFLDIVSPDWEALVSDDYGYIMPLPVKKKFGLKYIVQPILTQQLGVFSSSEINEQVVDSFVRSIPYFSYEMHLNEQNFTKKSFCRTNLILDLSNSFEKIEKKYSKNTSRNISKAQSNSLFVLWNLSVDEYLDFYFSTSTNYSKPQEIITRNLIHACLANNSTDIIGVYNEEQELISALCLLHSKERLIYLLPISNENGRETSAMFLLISEIIKKYAGSNKILDFEGSMIEGIARFYRGFGAGEVPYYLIKRFRPKFLIGL